ncbi:MAG: PIN domain-containing protein [Acidobacteriia bacterium]|nr:PIN domain-containing protein [Terriglobia bacterium]
MVLVDTSVWVEVFRKATRFRLESVVATDDVATCLPVVQEVLQGFRDERAFALARDAMLSFPVVESPLRTEVVLEAANLHRAARRGGLTVRSGVDCLIAACAIRNGLTVLHRDRDFDLIARISSLESRAIRF